MNKTVKEKKSQESNENKVPIFIMGKKYDVPASLTIQKALEYAGYQLIRGCGCRGGICGACGAADHCYGLVLFMTLFQNFFQVIQIH